MHDDPRDHRPTDQDAKDQDDKDTSPEGRDVSEFRDAHPELYGRLLQADERIARSAGRLGWWMAMTWVGLCIFIIAELTSEVLGFRVNRLQSTWIYVLLGVAFLMSYFRLASGRRRSAYRREQPDIVADTANARLNQATLLSAIQSHAPVSTVAAEIKADDEFERRRR